ncbi:MAG TPA: right-handed parallel beta-helix repeat-containing protein [Candidatus Krumholzibacteria bacterium]|nr:right-handed parallel beta-helix repeat-containing protein [Candidatus Krumholzibacteria bacterium]
MTWSVTRGTITPLNAAGTLVQWTVPLEVGVDSVTASANDGTTSRSVVTEIKVGTAFSGAIAPARFEQARSPYIVTVTGFSPVLAVTGRVTVIEPGTELLLETANTVIDVTDSLIAVGTPGAPIVIRPNVRNLTCGDDRGWWEGVKVYSDAPSHGYLELDYADLSYGRFSVRLRDQGSAVIRNSAIRCSGQNGVLHEGGGVLLLEDTQVTDGEFDGVAVDSDTFQPDSILVSNCRINFNGRTGVMLRLNDPLQDTPILIEYSEVRFNAEHGITLENAVFPEIHFNSFFGNGAGSTSGLNSIWLVNGYPGGASVTEVDATCNFWGAPVTNQSVIDAVVRDNTDTGAVGARVVTSPWSNENPLVTPSTCVVP